MKRRQVLALVGASTTFGAGCTLNPGSVSITVQNFTPERAHVRLQLACGDAECYANAVEVPGDGKRHLKDVVAAGNYTLTVSTDRFGDASRPVDMNRCEDQEVSVAILPSEELDVQLKRC
jgi:hypothetical protein